MEKLHKSSLKTIYSVKFRVRETDFFPQTVSDIERGWILVNKEQHRQLKSLQEKGSKKEVRLSSATHVIWSPLCLWAGKKLTTSIKAEVHSQTWMYYVEASSNLCLLDNHLCLTIFCPTVHQIGSDSEVLRLYQVWSLHHRFSWEGLSCYSRCRQQRTQLSRQIAQWSNERGQLQSHTHEMLAGHLICKFDKKKKRNVFYNNADIIAILHSKRSIVDVWSKQTAYVGQHHNFF